MNYSEEEQKYMKELETAFNEQRKVAFRRLSMTPERYLQLSYTYQKITDTEEMKDFAYISTHDGVREYYQSHSIGVVLSEKLSKIVPKQINVKSNLDSCTSYHRWIQGKEAEFCEGRRLQVDSKVSFDNWSSLRVSVTLPNETVSQLYQTLRKLIYLLLSGIALITFLTSLLWLI